MVEMIRNISKSKNSKRRNSGKGSSLKKIEVKETIQFFVSVIDFNEFYISLVL